MTRNFVVYRSNAQASSFVLAYSLLLFFLIKKLPSSESTLTFIDSMTLKISIIIENHRRIIGEKMIIVDLLLMMMTWQEDVKELQGGETAHYLLN